MRVLVVSHTYVTPENRRKLREMSQAGEVLALVPKRGQDVTGTQVSSGSRAEGFQLCSLPVLGSTSRGTRWFFGRVGAAWSEFTPDVLLVEQEVWSWALWQVLWLRGRYSPHAVVAIHSWESMPRRGWKGMIAGRFYRRAIRAARVVLVGNREARAIFCQHGASPDRVFVIPQVGLDPTALCVPSETARRRLRSALGFHEGHFVVGYSGRFVAEKGLWDLVDAVRQIATRRPSIRLALIGDGPLLGELLRRTSGSPEVNVLPAVQREELWRFYQALDTFVLASRSTPTWKEQLGMALAEAMACGLPVVGSSSGAIPDVVGQAGLVFPEGRSIALRSALERLMDDPALRRELGTRARARSTRLFSHRAVAHQTMVALENALGLSDERPDQYCDSLL